MKYQYFRGCGRIGMCFALYCFVIEPQSLSIISADVAVKTDLVTLAIYDRRTDAVSLFDATPEARRAQLAEDAWTIGLRALKNAHTQAHEAKLQDIGRALLEDVDRELDAHLTEQRQSMRQALAEYFDPQDGKLGERLAAFLNDEGVLGRVLESYLGPDRSVLAETLARQVGEHSPLFKKLSPTDSEGLVQILTSKLKSVLVEQQAEFGRALDPLEKDGAVGRFLRSLREELSSADEDRAEQLAKALAALDANDESSLLNRLVRETEQARRTLLLAINPELSDSPMAVLKSALETLLKRSAQSQHEMLEAQRARQEKFEKEVQSALARLETRREEELTSPRGGFSFQEAVSQFIHEAVIGGPYVATDTGGTTGSKRGCKVGDVVVRFTSESAFCGSAVVVEAKRDGSYTLARALEEMELARANREAEAGVFVLSASHASASFPRFSRYGKDLLVIWDAEDSRTDCYLHAALLAALSLASRKRVSTDECNIHALEDVAERVEAEISRLGKMRTHNETIRRNADSIAEEIRKGEDKLALLLSKASEVMRALNAEVHDVETERNSPISLPAGSLERASALVGSGLAPVPLPNVEPSIPL